MPRRHVYERLASCCCRMGETAKTSKTPCGSGWAGEIGSDGNLPGHRLSTRTTTDFVPLSALPELSFSAVSA